MVNAHLLAVTNAGTSPVNTSVAGCKNCPGSSATGEAPSFSTLLNAQTNATSTLLDAQTNATRQEAQTNEGSLLSDQPSAENDLANALISAPPPPPESLPAALLALAANDTLAVGEQALADDIAPAPLKPDALPVDLSAKPVSPAGQSQPLPSFAENLDAITGRIAPHTATGTNNIAGPGDQPAPVQTSPAGTIAAAPAPIIAQDNLAHPAALTNEAPQTQVNPADLLTVRNRPVATNAAASINTDQAPLATNESTVEKSAATASIPQPQSSGVTPLVLNDNARSSVSVTKQTDYAQLTRPTIEAETKAGSVAPKSNGEAPPAQTNPREMATSDAGAANKVTANAGTPAIDAPTPVKIERNAPLTPTNTTAPEPSVSPEGEARPASLMQRLKPLAQAAFSFQGMENAPNSAKTLDGMVPALSMTATGDLARTSGITGLTPTSNNPALPQVPLNNIAVRIASQASAGHQHFNIRLDPPELGRIDIRLEIGRDGQTMTHLDVEKPETLDLLRQDARTLERALNNAGLDSRNGSLSFSLKDDNKQQAGSSQSDGQPGADENHAEQEGDEPVISRTLNMSSGLDISI